VLLVLVPVVPVVDVVEDDVKNEPLPELPPDSMSVGTYGNRSGGMKSPSMPQALSPAFGHQKNSAWQHCSGGAGSSMIVNGTDGSALLNQSKLNA